MITIPIDVRSREGYNQFLLCKRLPKYEVRGNVVITDDQSYAYVFGGHIDRALTADRSGLFDYQGFVTDKALGRKRFADFMSPGLGKTRVELAFAKAISENVGKVLYTCPRMVMADILDEAARMNIPVSNLRMGEWNERIGLINYEARKPVDMAGVAGIVLDESGILKSGDGETARYLCDLAGNVEYRLANSATPSPNDQAEYAAHALFLGYTATLKEFYSRFFRKDGNDWVLKGHAVNPFYEHLSSWAVYLQSPSMLGFQRGGELDHEPEYIEVPSSDPEYMPIGQLLPTDMGLREASKIFSGLRCDPKSNRTRNMLEAMPAGQKIVWCLRNEEEKMWHKLLKNSAVLSGTTPEHERLEIVKRFREGSLETIVSKPKVLGFGVNLPQAVAQVYSGYDWSFEAFYQAVRRSHRFGRQGRLKVYIPLSDAETPIWETLKAKLRSFERDCVELQARFFRESVAPQAPGEAGTIPSMFPTPSHKGQP